MRRLEAQAVPPPWLSENRLNLLWREVPRSRWDIDLYYGPRGTPYRTYSRIGAFVDPVELEGVRFHLPPVAIEAMDETQRLALELARRTLADHGEARPLPSTRTAVIIGAVSGEVPKNAAAAAFYAPEILARLDRDGALAALPEAMREAVRDSIEHVLRAR